MTTQNSAQYANQIAHPPVIEDAAVQKGKVRIYRVNYTQSGAGSAGSLARLIRLPAGKFAYLQVGTLLKFSAFGSSRTLDVGYAAYQDQSGADVAAVTDGIHTDEDVSAAGQFSPGDALADGVKTFISRGGVTLTASVAGGTIPDGATIQGVVAIAIE